MKLSDNYKQLKEIQKATFRYRVSQYILIDAYERRSAYENSTMYRMMSFLNSKTLKEIIAFASGTWDHGLIPLRDCLIRIRKNWDDFGAEPCPYHFEFEIKQHQEEGGSYNENADTWKRLGAIVDLDGYVHNQDFPGAVEAFQELRKTGLRELSGEEREEFDKLT